MDVAPWPAGPDQGLQLGNSPGGAYGSQFGKPALPVTPSGDRALVLRCAARNEVSPSIEMVFNAARMD